MVATTGLLACLVLATVAISGLPPFGMFVSELVVIVGGFTSQHTLPSVALLIALIVVFCGVLNTIATLVLGPERFGSRHEAVAASNVVSMSLPLVVLLVFTVWLPLSARELLAQAAGIIRGVP